MIRSSRPARAGILLVLVAAVAAACSGSASDAPGIATLASADPGASGAPSASPASSADPQQAMVDFARCMREHGVDMPDPVFDSSGKGGVMIGGSTDKGAAPDRTKLSEADAACRHFLDSVTVGGETPEITQEQKDAMLAFSRCMRDHGVNMPDPVFSNNGATVQIGGDGMDIDPTSSTFKEAQAACQKDLPGGGPGGPGFGISGPIPADGGSGPSVHISTPGEGN